MYNLFVTNEARNDLREIRKYISVDLDNEKIRCENCRRYRQKNEPAQRYARNRCDAFLTGGL